MQFLDPVAHQELPADPLGPGWPDDDPAVGQHEPHAGAHHEQVRLAEQQADLGLELDRMPGVVVVAGRDESAAGLADPRIARAGQAGGAVIGQHPDLMVPATQGGQSRIRDFLVVDHEALDRPGVGLVHDGGDGRANWPGPAPRGQDHRDQGPALRVAAH